MWIALPNFISNCLLVGFGMPLSHPTLSPFPVCVLHGVSKNWPKNLLISSGRPIQISYKSAYKKKSQASPMRNFLRMSPRNYYKFNNWNLCKYFQIWESTRIINLTVISHMYNIAKNPEWTRQTLSRSIHKRYCVSILTGKLQGAPELNSDSQISVILQLCLRILEFLFNK